MTTNQITLTTEQIKLLGLDPSKQVILFIEDKPVEKWEPKQLPKGTNYYFIGAGGRVNLDTNYKTPTDKERRACGNLFLTKEEAEQASAELRAYLRLKAFAKEHDNDWAADWGDNNQIKYHVAYSLHDEKYIVVFTWSVQYPTVVYMSEEVAKLACRMLNESTLVL